MKTKEMVFAALFAAFIAVLGMIPPIPLGFIPVPVTAQTLGVMLAGCFLGRKTATISLILFVVLVALGLPLLSGGRGGLSVLVGPTAGYLLSWPLAAFCIGYATEKVWPSLATWKVITINFFCGVILINLIGAPVMALITHTSVWAGLVGALAFLPGDCIKAVIAAIIAVQVRAISPIEERAHSF
ncbi:biotin transport system substrate-specific component [Paenibacillus shirakamiensis]|uniref:Biotin transporter n=1 Tax=Paenibacillus shirakamiensis TaxID=1265935 RepID=A0ABS4JDU7_9BACL|nr:biotin transporter BioY [Paenibacillus shirakamiensis]MBP1999902.1 biotin transport system substrate-specific component [Paenibacillus shirakamiensis]